MKATVWSVVTVVLLTTSCVGNAPLFTITPPIPVAYQDEAARTGLAVPSITPWEEHVATLQPTFRPLSVRPHLTRVGPLLSVSSASLGSPSISTGCGIGGDEQ